MNKNCLTCKYEPKWPVVTNGEYGRSCGEYKYPVPKIKLPACITNHVRLKKYSVIKYKDNSGIYHDCAVWEPKK